MRKSEVAIIIIILISIIISFIFYPAMPEKVASHWNSKGEVDGYMSRFWGVFLMPIISIALFILLMFLPRIDPLKANVDKFRKQFDSFLIVLFVFLFYIYLLTLVWNMGIMFDMGQFMAPAMAVLFFYIGVLVENAKRNWFIGIRTPWTLSSAKVWDETHKKGGKLFKIAAVIVFLAVFFPGYAVWLILVPILFVTFYTIIYSYIVYKKEKKK